MNYIYICLVIFIGMFIISRKFDFVSFGAITFVLYTINCAFGKTWITGGRTGFYYDSDISTKTYIYVFVQLSCILFYLYKEKKGLKFFYGRIGERNAVKTGVKNEKTSRKFDVFWNMILWFSVFIILYTIVFNIGITNFFSYSRKSALLENVSGFFDFGIWGAVLSFLHAIQYSDKKKACVSFSMILITLVLGSRAYFATVVVGAIVIKYGEVKTTIRRNIKTIIGGILLVVFLLSFKNIYQDLRALNFAAIKENLLNSPITIALDDIAEFRTVFSLYDYVVSNDFKLQFIDSMARVLSIIPFLNGLLPISNPIRLSQILKVSLNSSYGVGGNFWAESLAMGGGVFLCIMTFFWLFFLNKSNKYINSRRDVSPFVITIASYCAFYIHRLDWVQVLGCFKSIFAFYLVYYIWKNINIHRGF